uniref:Transthyretin-like family protein n=1 Tax=Elaeophora elaphi TaxID=1147741 RepID=A0A0R3RLV2_9BILA
MKHILAKLTVVTLLMLVPQNYSETNPEKTKYPYPISVKGRMMCHGRGAYAVLLNIFEEVKYISYGNVNKGNLRTSTYFLSEHDGEFAMQGIRYATDHKIYLNITHHCIPDDKRDMDKNCFMQAKHEIEDDPRTVHYQLYDINLEAINYQSNIVKCVDWPYKYPEFNETVHDDL